MRQADFIGKSPYDIIQLAHDNPTLTPSARWVKFRGDISMGENNPAPSSR